jgi:hypothetical protein
MRSAPLLPVPRLGAALGLALLTLVAPAFVAVPSGFAASPSGLRGLVLRGPTQPACPRGASCEAPAQATLVFFAGAREAARVRTARDGRFRLALPPGRYGVRTLGPGFQRVPDPVAVDVLPGRFVRVVLRVDSGLR